MGAVRIITLTRAEAKTERARLLAQLGLTFDEAQAKADDYLFTHNEISVWWRIRDLTWLLDG